MTDNNSASATSLTENMGDDKTAEEKKEDLRHRL